MIEIHSSATNGTTGTRASVDINIAWSVAEVVKVWLVKNGAFFAGRCRSLPASSSCPSDFDGSRRLSFHFPAAKKLNTNLSIVSCIPMCRFLSSCLIDSVANVEPLSFLFGRPSSLHSLLSRPTPHLLFAFWATTLAMFRRNFCANSRGNLKIGTLISTDLTFKNVQRI